MFDVLFIVSLGQLKKKILREWSMYQFGSRTVAIVISDVLALYKTLCTQRCCHTYQTSSSSSLFYYKSLNTHQIIIKYKYSCHCNQRRACFTLTSPLVLNVVVIHLRHHYHRHHHQHRCRNTITAAIVIKLTNHWIHLKLENIKLENTNTVISDVLTLYSPCVINICVIHLRHHHHHRCITNHWIHIKSL